MEKKRKDKKKEQNKQKTIFCKEVGKKKNNILMFKTFMFIKLQNNFWLQFKFAII